MKHVLLKFSVATLLWVTTSCTSANLWEKSVIEQMDAVIFPAEWGSMISDAAARFVADGQNPECFTVHIRAESGLISISYLPDPDTKVSAEGRISTTRTKSSCGHAITFEYEQSGRFVQQYYNR